ncbi:hypothetical protein EDD55_1194, partial [Varunaivibrio sulfuroxidans]
AREVVIPAPGSKQAANPDPLALPDKPYCPKTLYGKWYPFTRAAMYNLGIMEIKKDRIRFSKHGEFPFKIRKGPRNVPYLELFNLPPPRQNGYAELDGYVYISYIPVLWDSCAVRVSLCTSSRDIEARIENDVLPGGTKKIYYCDGATYTHNKNKF